MQLTLSVAPFTTAWKAFEELTAVLGTNWVTIPGDLKPPVTVGAATMSPPICCGVPPYQFRSPTQPFWTSAARRAEFLGIGMIYPPTEMNWRSDAPDTEAAHPPREPVASGSGPEGKAATTRGEHEWCRGHKLRYFTHSSLPRP